MDTRNGELILELGDVHDNTQALAYAWSTRRDDPQMSLQILLSLRGHIETTKEAPSVKFILPKVLQAISILTSH